jgi:hypothetical protein
MMSTLSQSEKQQLKLIRIILVRQLRDLREIELVHLQNGDQHCINTDAACMLADVCRVLGLNQEDSNRVLGEAVRAILGD